VNVKLPQLSKSIDCEEGENLFHCLRSKEIAVASSCKGDGVCGKCVVTVTQGIENLPFESELERRLKVKYNYGPQQRISCQCAVHGDLEITTTYW